LPASGGGIFIHAGDQKFDGLVKSPKSRHPGDSRGPEVLVFPGFRLSPE
jgi:hypothetical protein